MFALWMVAQDPTDAGTRSSLAIVKLYFDDIRVKENKKMNIWDFIIRGFYYTRLYCHCFVSFLARVIILF